MGLKVPLEMEQFTANLAKKRTQRATRQSTENYQVQRAITKNTKYQSFAENEFKYKHKEKVRNQRLLLN